MKFNKILLVDVAESALDGEYWKQLKKLGDQVKHLPKGSPDFQNELIDADCLLVNFGISVTKEDINKSPRLKYIGILATAFGSVDIEHASKKNIPVCNLGSYSTESVAEFTIAVILEHARMLEEGKRRGRDKNYSFEGISATEIKDKHFGVIGLGSIGTRVAELAQGFNANARYWSRNRKDEAEKRGIQYQEIDDLIADSDMLSINLAQTTETENFLNENRILSLKKGVIVINTASMELVDIDALAKRLSSGDITFILDHSDEMSEEDLAKLSKYDNCIIYPPIAFLSAEARIEKQRLFVGNMKNFLKGSPTNQVN